ncbi:hypothetical protein [Jidongwangia harbinensis]|uniref:hypothetical protein n=1 Tax=Jidongwangia harbinensis TaxID=2878561 RepID=UPI001CD93596|nr:hypothetical protein [Jidongwangia harbinensis]MCA2215458.1 hypothetical protein [Jidongwangia harbinensis]
MTDLRLITVGLAEYAHRPDWTVRAAADSRTRMESLLAPHGVPAEDWTDQATTQRIAGQLTSWARRDEESEIVYWTGHGEFTGDGYFLALADSEELVGNDALSDAQLSAALLRLERMRAAGTGTDWVLLILDTCGSLGGAWKIWTSFRYPPRNVGVIATTDDGAAHSGAFPELLADVLTSFNGNDTDAIPVTELLRRLEARLGAGKVNAKFEPTAVLPNRLDDLPPLQAAVDVYAELREVLATAPAELRNHFYAKAQGAEIGEAAWNFTGRLAERRRIAEWLRTAPAGLLVVSGPAGSGKSALLGMMLAAADPQVRAALTVAGHTAIPDDLTPGDLVYDAVLHLTGQTVADTVASLVQRLGLKPAATPDELFDHLYDQQDAPRTVIADALDEARDPYTIAGLLRRLAAVPGHRVLVGTRPSLRDDLDQRGPSASDVLDVLAADPSEIIRLSRDPGAVRGYVRNRLAELPLAADRVADVAARVAAAAQPFLYARLAVHEIRADPALAESDEALERLLGAGHRGIFGQAVHRLGVHAPDAAALLEALAYARGSGFPRTGGIWEDAARHLRAGSVTDASVTRVLELAAPYIMQDSESGQAVYRLAHRTFTEWYRRREWR